MTKMQQECTDTQIALEKRARQVSLGLTETNLLQEHLPSCAVCSAFVQTLNETDKVMYARAETLKKEVDFGRLAERAHASIRKQKRGMVRGAIGYGAFLSLFVLFYFLFGDLEWLLYGSISLLAGLGALVLDLIRLDVTSRWASRAPVLDIGEARRARKVAIAKLAGLLLLGFAPAPWPDNYVLGFVLSLLFYLALFHFVFVVRALHAEVRALRD